MWSSGIVGAVADEIVPCLTVAVEGPGERCAVECEVVAADQPGGGLVLVAYGEGGGEPVGDVCGPL